MAAGTSDNLDGGVRTYLPWLIDMGADEIILDQPINRFAEEKREVAPVPSALPQLPNVLRPPGAPAPLASSGDLAADAMALVADAVTIADLTNAWLAFEGHPLKRTATRLCFFGGSTAARALVLCDKPRTEEDPMGEVLSAKHQVLAENMLAAIGLCSFSRRENLEQIALANFVPWRPPGNRAVIELEAKLSIPFAHRLLALLKPRAVLCLGALPGQYLADGDPAITRARGKWRNVEVDGHQFPLMTTFHPETLLKSPQSKKLAWQDLQAFRDRLNEP
jgi:uracil-DNA glycosylase family 4